MSQSDFVSRGQALVAAGQFQEAVKVCRLGLLGRPTTVEGRVVLGEALFALNRFDEVLAEMRVALELDNSSVAAQLLRAQALLRKGDGASAIEALRKARQHAPDDPQIAKLLAETERAGSRGKVAHPSDGFVETEETLHYPNLSGEDDDGGPGHTGLTALQSPGSARRSSQRRAAAADPFVPPPAAFEVGNHTGTVEVDPDLEGVEVGDEREFDPVAPAAAAKPRRGGSKQSPHKTPTQQLQIDDLEELAQPRRPEPRLPDPRLPGLAPAPSRGAAVANALGRASGVIGESLTQRAKAKSVPPPRSKPVSSQPPPRATAVPGTRLASLGIPDENPGPPTRHPPPSPGPSPLPAAASLPPAPVAPLPTPSRAANAQLPPSQASDQLFGNDGPPPMWASAPPAPPAVAAASGSSSRPGELDPAVLALMSGSPRSKRASSVERASVPRKTGVRKIRSRLQVVMWGLIGGLVIGGGVFAGFWIRAMRLDNQILAARKNATDLAQADTWGGWSKARDSLAAIVQAASTPANREALARSRALIAYEFGEGLAEAKRDVAQLGASDSLDANLARAFVALAQSDVKLAKSAATNAVAGGSDPAALYVAGQAALLAGDPLGAISYLKAAADKDARPLVGIGLARAHAAAYNWDDAVAALDRVLAGHPDHPAAVIARGSVLAASGRITPGSTLGNELHAQLERIIGEGRRPLGEQQHGVSVAQVAFANLAIAQVDVARGDVNAARNAIFAAAQINLDDQRFAEDAVEALYTIGDLKRAQPAAEGALKQWPLSRRARLTLARVLLAQGKANDAIDVVGKQPDVVAQASGLAVRGQALLATGELSAAARDLDAALKQNPNHEPALIGRAWLELATGDIEAATKRIAQRYNPKGSTAALTTVYAATLRRSADTVKRTKANELLANVVQGRVGPDVARAQLELARMFRDTGDPGAARTAYEEASRDGSVEARLESALLAIEDRAPPGGREAIDALLVEAGDRPTPQLVIEGARARMLDGNHAGAAELLDRADKMSTVERWKVDRERGRLLLRKSDVPGASAALSRALDACGSDPETFLLAGNAAIDPRAGNLIEKVRKLAPLRLKGKPEAEIVTGTLLIADNLAGAETAYRTAKAALVRESASARRLAQADLGLAVVAYTRKDLGAAQKLFELAMAEDPSIVDAYVFLAEIVKNRKRAYDFARKAAQLNPDYPYAWQLVGQFAARLRDKPAFDQAVKRLQAIAPNGDELKQLRLAH